MTALPDPSTFLSGEHGEVGGRRGALRRGADRALDRLVALQGALSRIDALAANTPPREIRVIGIYRPGNEPPLDSLRSDRHHVRVALGATGAAASPLAKHTVARGLAGGKFENLNALLGDGEPPDWTLVVDDDIELPARFLDRFIALCEHFDLALAQPAQSLASHAAWRVLRRHPGSLVRETAFVEIGPVTAFRHDAAAELLPFPPLRYGWGLDLAWGALARERGWRCGVVDALPVRHERAAVATAYSADAATAEAQRFLADRPYLTSAEARRTLATHRRLAR